MNCNVCIVYVKMENYNNKQTNKIYHVLFTGDHGSTMEDLDRTGRPIRRAKVSMEFKNIGRQIDVTSQLQDGNWFGNKVNCGLTLQFIYTTRHYTHYIGTFRSGYIYSCFELIPVSRVITYEMVMIRAPDNFLF
jgi:hypothetical protein